MTFFSPLEYFFVLGCNSRGPSPLSVFGEEWIISFCGIILKFKMCQYGEVNGSIGTENVVVNLN